MPRLRVPTLVLAVAAGCVHPIGGALEHAAEAQEPPPEDFELVYQEREGPLGARDIVVRGDGTLRLERWRPGFVPSTERPEAAFTSPASTDADALAERRELRLRPAQMQRLVRTLTEIEAWEQRSADELPSAPLEGSRVILRLRLGEETSEVWEYARDLEAGDRLVRVRRVLDEILQGAPASPSLAP